MILFALGYWSVLIKLIIIIIIIIIMSIQCYQHISCFMYLTNDRNVARCIQSESVKGHLINAGVSQYDQNKGLRVTASLDMNINRYFLEKNLMHLIRCPHSLSFTKQLVTIQLSLDLYVWITIYCVINWNCRNETITQKSSQGEDHHHEKRNRQK